MASQGPLSPGTVGSDPDTLIGYGSPMVNVNNVKVSDNVYSDNSAFNNNNSGLRAQNFGFSIPTGSTINGVLVEIELKASSSSNVSINYLKLIKSNGTVGSQNKCEYPSNYYLPVTETYASWGSSSDLWSDTWTAEDINDTDFGIVLLMAGYDEIGYIDHIRITVYYTAGGGSANTGFFGLM